MSSDGSHHSIDYIELSVVDIDAAKAFYSAAFGWAFTDYGPGYAGFSDGTSNREAGGLALVDEPPNAERAPLIVLYSDDLEESLGDVETAGGTIVAPIFEFPGGHRFEFFDPAGNRLAVWTET